MPPTTAVILRDLHRLRRHAKNLKDEIDRLPKMLQVQQGKVKRQEDALKQTQEKITKLKLAAKDKEGRLKQTHDNLAKYQKQLDTVANKKEMDALQVELAHGKESNRKLEEEIFAAMEETEQLTAKLPELNQAVAQAKTELANFDQIQQEKRAVLTGELNKAEAELKEVETGLPEDLKVMYMRLVSQRGEDAMSEVNGRTCVACYTEITAQMYNNLLMGSYVPCRNCGRVLYLPE